MYMYVQYICRVILARKEATGGGKGGAEMTVINVVLIN